MAVPPTPPPGSGFPAAGGKRETSVTDKLRLVRANLSPALRAAPTIKEMARLTLAFLSEHIPFAFGAVLQVGADGGVEILAGPETVPIADLMLHTPESPAGYALAQDELVYLPDLRGRTLVRSDAKKTALGDSLHIVQTTVRAVIPTLEDKALPNLQRNHWEAVLFIPLTFSEGAKVLLVLGFNKEAPPPEELKVVPMLALGVSALFHRFTAQKTLPS